MAFSVKASKLREAIRTIIPLVSGKTAYVIAQNVLIKQKQNHVELYATNLEVHAKTVLEVLESADHSKEPISVAVSPKIINDLLKNLDDDDILTFANVKSNDTGTDLVLSIVSNHGKYSIVAVSDKHFPAIDFSMSGVDFDIRIKDLLDIIDKTSFATSKDNLRPHLAGVYFHFRPEMTTFVSSDGFMMIKLDNKGLVGGGTPSVIVPANALNAIQSALKKLPDEEIVKITASKDHFLVYHPLFTMKCQTLNYSYPDYESIIPAPSDKIVIVEKNKLINAIKRLKYFADKSNEVIYIRFGPSLIDLKTRDVLSHYSGSEYLTCEYSGEEMEMSFKVDMLLDVLSVLDTPYVKLNLYQPQRPILIEPHPVPEDSSINIVELVMPFQEAGV